VELGKLKGNKGNQTYTVPADADLSGLRSVTIWSGRFDVSYGAAALS
jgi:Electron transfer DM13